MTPAAIVFWFLLALACAAIGYTVAATLAMRRFARAPRPVAAPPEPVSLLKPLHGPEPQLAENLASFLRQDWPAPIQLVAGTGRADDPALTVVRSLSGDVAVRTGAPAIGGNAKVANLANMLPAAAHNLLVLSDSDMAAPRDYLPRVAAAMAGTGVGAATCLYRGRGDAGPWSRLAAAGISWQFTPGVATSLMLGVEHPCMGSTIAIRRGTLDAIGGFAAFSDTLADDYEVGAAVRRLGLAVAAVPGLLLVHGCAETSLPAVWRHELRWARTVRAVNGLGHLGSLLTHPLPLALLVTALRPEPGLALAAIALAARLALARTVDAAAEDRTAPLAWLPARDLLSFAVFLASFGVRRVDWRGTRLGLGASGRIAAGAGTGA